MVPWFWIFAPGTMRGCASRCLSPSAFLLVPVVLLSEVVGVIMMRLLCNWLKDVKAQGSWTGSLMPLLFGFWVAVYCAS
jgi:hypothetical protein